MKIKPFTLERYFAKYEFSAPYLLSCSDCEPLTQKELLSMADKQSLEMWDKLWLGYTESQGHPVLREEVAKFHSQIKPSNVLVVVPEEGIFITMNTILEKGDHVVSTFPGYQSLYEVANSIGCEVTNWTPIEEKGWSFDLETLRKSIKPNTKLIVINFPHNPTGSLLSKEEFEEVLRIAKEKNIFVFSDEMYRFLEYKDTDRLESASDLYENAISLFGVSKTFSLAGLRIGWLTTQNKELFSKMANFKDYTTICSSAPSEILSVIALRAKDIIIGRHLTRIKRNLTLLDDFFKRRHDLFEWVRPRAGTIGFPRFKGDISSIEFCQKLVKETGIMLLPSTVYDYDDKHFRIGFGRENMPEALEKFDKYLSH